MVILLGGCASTGNSGITYGDFRNKASMLAGVNSIDCGNAEIGLGLEQNTCVSNAFKASNSAFATYDLQGFDSRVANSLAVSTDGRVHQLFFDGNPIGGVQISGGSNTANGKIELNECINATLSGVINNQPAAVFSCD